MTERGAVRRLEFMRIVKVPLGERTYRIYIGPGLREAVGEGCRALGLGRRCAVISDANVAPLYLGGVIDSLRKAGFDPVELVIPAGEKSKNLRLAASLCERLAAHRLERGSFIAALGGGVVGDIAGFLAAIYLRGVRFVQIPTSLLAQVDSSVGGKTGVNLKAGKNLAGAFHQPAAVWIDTETLRTLPEREFRAGLSEVIKYGAIADAALFRRLERDLDKLLALDPDTLGEVTARCCRIKAGVVARDEREGGLRAILNFGHTVGHAIEKVSGYGRYLHGEAVALGQVAAARISHWILGFPETDVARLRALLERAGLPTSARTSAERVRKLHEAMRLDKKVRGGEIKFVLLKRLGEAVWGEPVPRELIARSLGVRAEGGI